MRKFVFVTTAFACAVSIMGETYRSYPSGSGSPFCESNSLRGKIDKVDFNRPLKSFATGNDELFVSWGYSEDPGNAYGFTVGLVKQAICMPAAIAADFAGSEVRSLTVGTPIDYKKYVQTYQMVNPITEATVWISESLEGEPVAMATGSLREEGLSWSTIELDAPYVITGDKDLYFGYTYTIEDGTTENWQNNPTWGLVTDFDVPNNDNSNFLYSTFAGVTEDGMALIFSDEPQWMNMAPLTGANACVRADIYGDNVPVDVVDIQAFDIPRWVKTGEEFEVVAQIRNRGGNSISNIDMNFALDGMPLQSQEVNIITGYDYSGNPVFGSLPYNGIGFVCAGFTVPEDGDFDYVLSVLPVDSDNRGDNFTVSSSILALTDGFRKNNVVEEGTGTWCGWCVLGIAGMKYMHDNYADRGFIGIALHIDDPMDVLRYSYDFALENYRTFPTSYMNRNYWRETYPVPDSLEEEFLMAEDFPSVANIKATLSSSKDKKVTLTTSTEFCLNMENADYGVAYTVVEKNVGPYVQKNYCAGASSNYYGYENEPAEIVMDFNEVARNCSNPLPIDGSLPTLLVKGEKYEFTTEIDLYDVADLNEYSIVAMVVNRKTGLIENACVVESPDSGIDDVMSESQEIPFAYAANGSVKYLGNNIATVYTTDGRVVALLSRGEQVSLSTGMYIIVDRTKTLKLIVK